MTATVTALLVSHDGARWLPGVLRGLGGQTVPPLRTVAVDTGSQDGSAALLRDHPAISALVEVGRDVAYPRAVRTGLQHVPEGAPREWIWLLHDDCAPAPDALERLLAAADGAPGVDVLGPKIREWPSLRRLLEVGVTISGTGRRETGLERGEHDQGQHDTMREVLAVNTAGMLIRRSLLTALGLDEELPVTHADLDLGWRAARAGHRVHVAPEAVVFHAEASRTGLRDPAQGPAARRAADRQAALYTVLANCRAAALPFVAVRLVVGTLLRALGLLLVRAPREAGGEVRALLAAFGRPGRLFRARRRRRATATVAARDVRPLLAPAWLPYRHGLDELTAIGVALLQATRVAPSGRPPEAGGWWQRAGRGPGLWLVLGLAAGAVIAGWPLLGDGRLAGGALLPAPASVADWWREYLSTTHDVDTGSAVTAPAYLLPLAMAGSVLLGNAGLLIDLLVVGAVPLAAAGAYRFLVRLSGARWPAAWGAATYGLLLPVGGAVAQGRLGTIVAALVLPWLAASALGLGSASADRCRRAAWRTALWLAVGAAFAPLLWWLAAAVTLLVAGNSLATGRPRLGPVLVPAPVSAFLLLPWTALVWSRHGASALVQEAGVPAIELLTGVSATSLVGGRSVEVGAAPEWVVAAFWVLALLALLALLRGSTRAAVLCAWAVALVSLGATWILLATDQGWVGLPVLAMAGAWVVAAVVASSGLRARLTRRSFGWRQPAGLLVAGVAMVAPVAGSAWWLASGVTNPLDRVDPATVPVYMDDAAERDPAQGTAVVTGAAERGYEVTVRRGEPLTVGTDAMLPSPGDRAPVATGISDLVTAPRPDTVNALAEEGVAFVFAPAPVDPSLSGALDAAPGLTAASAAETGGRAWRLEADADLALPSPEEPAWLRPALLVVQGLGVVTVVALAAPTRRRAR